MKGLIEELRSRSVIRALVAYSVVSWVLLQVADVTFERLPIPEQSMTVLIALVIIGFPVTAVLAWGYELTSAGIVKHGKAGPGAGRLAFLPFIMLVAVAAVAGGGGLYYLSQYFWEPSRRAIAILPFNASDEEAGTRYLGEGLTEEIQSLIVRLDEFRVVALSTSTQVRETMLDVLGLARRLDAEAVLLGSVRRFGDRVSITARLINTDDGTELWSENYNQELSDIYAIQEDIARKVARALHVVLPVSAERRLKKLGTRNVDAYDAYLRGIEQLRKPPDETSLLLAEGFLRESMAIDPDFGNAHAAMCEKHLAGYRLSRDPERFADAEAACRRALDFHGDAVDVHLALGGLYLESGRYEAAGNEYEEALDEAETRPDVYIGLAKLQIVLGQSALAEANLRKAIELDVSNWASFNAMGNFLFEQGRFIEAAEFYQMFLDRADNDAQALNNLGAAHYLAGDFRAAAAAWEQSLAVKPTRSAYSNTGSMYFYLGDFEKAADRYAKAVNLAPNDYRLWGNLADAYFFSNDKQQVAEIAYKRAVEFGERQLEINAKNIDALSDVALYHARLGHRGKALAMTAEAQENAPNDMYVHYNDALIQAQFGNVDAALDSLRRALELDYERQLLGRDPAFEALRGDARFVQLLSGEPQSVTEQQPEGEKT